MVGYCHGGNVPASHDDDDDDDDGDDDVQHSPSVHHQGQRVPHMFDDGEETGVNEQLLQNALHDLLVGIIRGRLWLIHSPHPQFGMVNSHTAPLKTF